MKSPSPGLFLLGCSLLVIQTLSWLLIYLGFPCLHVFMFQNPCILVRVQLQPVQGFQDVRGIGGGRNERDTGRADGMALALEHQSLFLYHVT